jgi:hypothetical protein
VTGRRADMVVGPPTRLRFGDRDQIEAIRVLAEVQELVEASGGRACQRHGDFVRMDDDERESHLRWRRLAKFDGLCPA